jgi:hypothetical protein
MRGKDATPFIDRKRCIQHDSVFVAAIKKKEEGCVEEGLHSNSQIYLTVRAE